MEKIINLVIVLVIFSGVAFGNQIDSQTKGVDDILEKVSTLEQQLSEVRRDQLNYSIEKNLLKEAYGSNIQTINLMITVVLATFTVFAFFGIKSIGNIREDFRDELRQLREVRGQSEERLKEIEFQQKRAKEELEKISISNATQDTRLRVLELIEKVSSYIQRNFHHQALEYIEIGLDMDSDNTALLEQKELCLLKLKRFPEALSVLEKILKLDPENDRAALNLCELSLFTGHHDRYLELRNKLKDVISRKEYLAWFFDAVELYQTNKDKELVGHIRELIDSITDENLKQIDWGFEEAQHFIVDDNNRDVTSSLLRTLKVLKGKMPASEVFTEN
ncbi:tetratricopeptide repeat protein [Leucothrix mucor]|uniref:tetratricopeptide repeat protein n=1 Tax=Leucothrix mucor TaxID=45248 RepID=UPI0003B55B42|nr:tetratricopeptide repeat protein [Leucothrix mucor]